MHGSQPRQVHLLPGQASQRPYVYFCRPAADLAPHLRRVYSQAEHVESSSAHCHLAFNWRIAVALLHRAVEMAGSDCHCPVALWPRKAARSVAAKETPRTGIPRSDRLHRILWMTSTPSSGLYVALAHYCGCLCQGSKTDCSASSALISIFDEAEAEYSRMQSSERSKCLRSTDSNHAQARHQRAQEAKEPQVQIRTDGSLEVAEHSVTQGEFCCIQDGQQGPATET